MIVRRFILARCGIVALGLTAVLGRAAAPAEGIFPTPATGAGPTAAYREVDLAALVAASRTGVPGQRIIFAPTPVRFRAVLAALPAPQASAYLMKALAITQEAPLPKVSQRIVLDYGGDKPLAAYIEEGAAKRLAREVKVGARRTFHAFHAYNQSTGPALLVTSFDD